MPGWPGLLIRRGTTSRLVLLPNGMLHSVLLGRCLVRRHLGHDIGHTARCAGGRIAA